MKIPTSVVWQLTKRWNSHLVTFNGQQFTHDPLSLTNLHNGSQAGLSNNQTIGLSAKKVQAKKGTRPVYTLLQSHKSHNKILKKKKTSSSGLAASTVQLRRGINRVGKVVKSLSNISEKTRRIALRRLQRLHVATRPHVKGGAAKKEEKK